jgi:hypothetical protein
MQRRVMSATCLPAFELGFYAAGRAREEAKVDVSAPRVNKRHDMGHTKSRDNRHQSPEQIPVSHLAPHHAFLFPGSPHRRSLNLNPGDISELTTILLDFTLSPLDLRFQASREICRATVAMALGLLQCTSAPVAPLFRRPARTRSKNP